MNDTEILEQISNLRIQLSQQVSEIDASDHANLMIAVSIFIAGVDALFQLRNDND